MIQFTDIIQIVADSFFGGSLYVGGTVVLITVLAVIMVFSKKIATTLLLGVPVVMIFAYLGVLPDEITLIMLVVIVVGLAYTTKDVFR